MSEDEPDVSKLANDPELRSAIIGRYQAQTAKFQAEAREAAARAEAEEIVAAKARRDDEEELAKDKYHHLYSFSRQVDDSSVASCIERLSYWSRTGPECNIEIVFNSPGGGVIAGLALFDFIQELRRRGPHITTHALGHAASMAGILLQAGDERIMGRESWILIHEVSFAAIGKIVEIEDHTKWVKKIQKRILAIFAERSTLTIRQIERRWKRQDWWLDSDECLRLGLVDNVR